jgi:hypothetical protein
MFLLYVKEIANGDHATGEIPTQPANNPKLSHSGSLAHEHSCGLPDN